MREIRCLAASFGSCLFTHVFGEGNSVADAIARSGLDKQFGFIILPSVSCEIRSLASSLGMDDRSPTIDSLVEQTKGWKCQEVELSLKDDPLVNARAAQRMLVGKLLSDEVLNNRAVKVTVRKSWRTGATMDIYDVEANVFIFVFYSSDDKQRILSQGPWTIMGAHLILK
ncbi:hypothetical protein Tsubulata_030231 [Turnera subulata]|uniref:DUF4283 domain-containing protein n=1 Tax=Turnera subulata TaxID=218843 RepID=A0A9Q0G4B7_9ROSI|nr:hypothetical protein Tsubulata_030231 [Turnera subulata]